MDVLGRSMDTQIVVAPHLEYLLLCKEISRTAGKRATRKNMIMKQTFEANLGKHKLLTSCWNVMFRLVMMFDVTWALTSTIRSEPAFAS